MFEIKKGKTSIFVLFLKKILAIWGPLWAHMILEFFFYISVNNAFGIMIGIAVGQKL